MAQDIQSEVRLTVGIDLGDKYSHFSIVGRDGVGLEEGRVATSPEALRQKFGVMKPARIALEVGTHLPWITRLLEECGHCVVVANARKLRMIFQNDSKSDRVDAEQLARVARLDPRLLSPIRHRGRQAQQDLSLIRARDCLVTTRTKLVNHIRGTLKSFGIRASRCSTPTFDKKVMEFLPKKLRPAVDVVGICAGNIGTRWQTDGISPRREPSIRQCSFPPP